MRLCASVFHSRRALGALQGRGPSPACLHQGFCPRAWPNPLLPPAARGPRVGQQSHPAALGRGQRTRVVRHLLPQPSAQHRAGHWQGGRGAPDAGWKARSDESVHRCAERRPLKPCSCWTTSRLSSSSSSASKQPCWASRSTPPQRGSCSRATSWSPLRHDRPGPACEIGLSSSTHAAALARRVDRPPAGRCAAPRGRLPHQRITGLRGRSIP